MTRGPGLGIVESVVVRRHWNDWRTARYRLEHLSGVHWSDVSGGHRARSPQQFLHGYVICDGEVEGELSHSGSHGDCPHRIKVCVVMKDNDPATIAHLRSLAGPKPSRSSNQLASDQPS